MSEYPRVELFDMGSTLVDEEALRALARARCHSAQAPFRSRSYAIPLALAAWHDAPVGVDIERVGTCDSAFLESISTPAELQAQAREQPTEIDLVATSLWSSKEALSKALGDPLAYDPRRLEGPGSWPGGRSGPWRATTLDVGPAHVAWVCWRSG